MDEITREEAAQILQVDIDASADEVNEAYKKATRKFHPDVWLNKDPELQKRAEENYTKLVPAKNKLLEPYEDYLRQKQREEVQRANTAAQRAQQQAYRQAPSNNKQYQDVSTGYSNSGYSGYQYQPSAPQPQRPSNQGQQYSPNQPYSYDGSASWDTGSVSSEYMGATPRQGRQQYNHATSFKSSFGKIPDAMEDALQNMYNSELDDKYSEPKDRVKLTFSIVPTLLTLMVLILSVLGIAPVTLPFFSVTTENAPTPDYFNSVELIQNATETFNSDIIIPALIIFGILIVKFLLYDFILSYIIQSKVPVLKGITIAGIETILLSLGTIIALFGKVNTSLFFIMLIIGIIAIIVGVIENKTKKAVEEKRKQKR